MMMNNMMNNMMTGIILTWIVIGLLLGLLLAAVIWFLAHWRNEQRLHQMNDVLQPSSFSHPYEQGYRPPEPSPEAYQEDGQRYYSPRPKDEQPMAQYPQEMPLSE